VWQVLARGDRIQLLVDRTEDLQAHAQQFQKQGRQLRNRMWWCVLNGGGGSIWTGFCWFFWGGSRGGMPQQGVQAGIGRKGRLLP
jgi:hypothetical protein